jgi:hypothetical protein
MSSKTIRVPQNEGEKYVLLVYLLNLHANLIRLLGGAVNVVVGPQNKIFIVHKNLIRGSSPFFDKAMSVPWQESSQHTVQLPEGRTRHIRTLRSLALLRHVARVL